MTDDRADAAPFAAREAAAPTEVPDAADYWTGLGSRLRRAREYLGFSQAYVADRTGIARSAISDIERGARKVDSLELRKFARLFRLPVSRLAGEEGDGVEAPVQALARSMSDLTEGDLKEVAQFAEFLRFSAAQARDGETNS